MAAAENDNVHFAEFGFPSVCQTCSAHRYGICGALRAPDLVTLSKHTAQRHVGKGETIAYEGDEADEFVNIVSGIVKLTKTMPDGRHQIVALQFPPEFVGRPFSGPHEISAEAATDLEICILPRRAIEAASAAEPSFERRMFEQTAAQLDQARDWMLALGRKTALERVASVLEMFRAHGGRPVGDRPGATEFQLGLTRTEIADFLGLTIETVSRQMTKLRKDGVIEIANHHDIIIPDADRLRALCAQDGSDI